MPPACDEFDVPIGNSEMDLSVKCDRRCYAIICYNSRTYQSTAVLPVVRGKETAD
jgi:hypothetical protein